MYAKVLLPEKAKAGCWGFRLKLPPTKVDEQAEWHKSAKNETGGQLGSHFVAACHPAIPTCMSWVSVFEVAKISSRTCACTLPFRSHFRRESASCESQRAKFRQTGSAFADVAHAI